MAVLFFQDILVQLKVVYRAIIQSGNCSIVNSTPVTITVNNNSNPGILISDTAVCISSNSGSLILNSNNGSILRWESSTNAGTSWQNINNTNNTLSFTNLTSSTLFRVVVQNGSCGIANSNSISVKVNPLSNAGSLAASTTVCANNNNGTLLLTGNTGNIISWEYSTNNGGAWSTIANTNNTFTYNNLNTSTAYRAIVQNQICPPAYSNVVNITVLQAATIANAGTDQTLCNQTSTTLAANTPASGTGTWTAIASNPSTISFSNTSDPNTTVSGLVSGTYQFIWTISNALCADSKDTVQVTVVPPTVAGALSADAIVCATANNNTLTLSGSTGAIISWEYSTNNGGAWNTIANTNNTYTYNNLITSTAYRAIVQNQNCPPAYSNVVNITVLQAATIANAGTDQTLCNQTSTTLAANTPVSGTGIWTAIASNPSSASFSNANDPNTTVSGLVAGTYQFVWTISNALCADSKDTVQVIVVPPTNPGTLSAAAVVCANNNNNTLTLTGSIGTIISWESSINNGSTWSTIANSNNTFTYNNLITSTAYRAIVQNQNCPPAYSNVVNITVLQAATIANAGTDQTLCNQTSTTLAANTPVSGTGTWTAIASNPSTVSFSNVSDPNTTVSGLVAGTYQFVWTISNALCADSKDTIQVIIAPPTNPGTLSAATVVCANNNNNTLTLTGSIGTIISWESSINNGSTWSTIANTNNTFTYNNLNTSTAYRAIVQNQNCPPAFSNVVNITVLQAATIANAGTDQTLCNQTSTTLAANTPASGTGTWTAIASNPSTVSFSNVSDPNTTVSGLVAGTYQFVWTISNALCADSKDTIQVIIAPPTNPGILSSDATVCANSNSGILSLNGYVSTIQHWESSLDNSNWNAIVNTTNTLSYANLTNSLYYRVSVKNGVCPSLFSNTVRITVLPAPTIADAGPDTTLINGFSSYKLTGNIPSSGTGIWTIIPPYGPSTLLFTDTSDANATIRQLAFHYADSTTIPIIPPSDGIYYLKWTISNGICPASESVMVVTVQPPTNPGFAGADTVVCAGSNNGIVKLKGYFGDILQWEDSTSNATSWHIIPRTIGTDQDTIHFENLSSTTMYRALVKNGVGLSLYSGIAATVTVLDQVTTANAGKDSSICNTTSVQLWGNHPTVGTGTWSYLPLSSSGSNPSFNNTKDPNAIVTGLANGTYQFVWTISNGSCNNSYDTVNITILAPTDPGILLASNVVCANNNGTLHLLGYNGSVLQSSYSTDNGINWLSINNSSNKDSINYNNLPVSTQFRVEVKNGVCPALFSNIVSITVLSTVSISAAGTDQTLCDQTTTTLAANTPASGTGIWTAIASNPSTASFSNANDPNATVAGLIAGTYQFVWTISNVLCADSKDTMQVTVVPPTVAGTLSADAIVCATANSDTLSLSGSTGAILTWEYSTNNGGAWSTIANTNNTYTYNNLITSTDYRAIVQNQICPSVYSNIVNITVLQTATIAAAGTDQTLCDQTTTTLAANTPA
ncbi:MAG: hypothetical protein NTZ19_03635, partial [Bacteroidetes bacterium]|nr:hypothetical protein [Bacteroidota bacterium]